MWRLVLLGCVGACGFQIATSTSSDDEPLRDGGDDAVIDVEPAHWLPGYTHRRRIEVSSGQSVALDDFVVAIIVPDDAGLAANARDDGQDLIVTAVDDTILDYELERFSGTTGALTMWVRVPSLAAHTALYLYYGGEIRLHDARTTWSAQTFRAVWHMTDAVGTLARDSAGPHDLASSGSTNLPLLQDGIAGLGRGFDGINDMVRDDVDDDTLDFGLASFSYSVWVNVATSAGPFDMPMYKGGSSAGTPGFDIELGTNNWTTYIGDGTQNRPVTVANETFNTWVNITGVVDRASQQLLGYKDGVVIMKADINDIGAIASNSTFVIGSNGGNYWFRGRVDEPRIYARALTAEWIAAEHANLRSPSTFAAVAAEEMAP